MIVRRPFKVMEIVRRHINVSKDCCESEDVMRKGDERNPVIRIPPMTLALGFEFPLACGSSQQPDILLATLWHL